MISEAAVKHITTDDRMPSTYLLQALTFPRLFVSFIFSMWQVLAGSSDRLRIRLSEKFQTFFCVVALPGTRVILGDIVSCKRDLDICARHIYESTKTYRSPAITRDVHLATP
jgi:hypothetical protein